jgi:uncharacterized protein
MLDPTERRLHPNVRTLWRWSRVVSALTLGSIGSVPLVLLAMAGRIPWWPVVAPIGGAMLAMIIGLVMVRHSYEAWRFAITEDALELSHGVFWRTTSAVPYHRIHQLDVEQGPLQRKLGLVALRLRTASAASDGAIPGLDPTEAETLRRLLLARSGAPLEGE